MPRASPNARTMSHASTLAAIGQALHRWRDELAASYGFAAVAIARAASGGAPVESALAVLADPAAARELAWERPRAGVFDLWRNLERARSMSDHGAAQRNRS